MKWTKIALLPQMEHLAHEQHKILVCYCQYLYMRYFSMVYIDKNVRIPDLAILLTSFYSHSALLYLAYTSLLEDGYETSRSATCVYFRYVGPG
jgi:hypothetical protein